MDYRERFAEENSKLQERMNIISDQQILSAFAGRGLYYQSQNRKEQSSN